MSAATPTQVIAQVDVVIDPSTDLPQGAHITYHDVKIVFGTKPLELKGFNDTDDEGSQFNTTLGLFSGKIVGDTLTVTGEGAWMPAGGGTATAMSFLFSITRAGAFHWKLTEHNGTVFADAPGQVSSINILQF